jgi:hypothetical protein
MRLWALLVFLLLPSSGVETAFGREVGAGAGASAGVTNDDLEPPRHEKHPAHSRSGGKGHGKSHSRRKSSAPHAKGKTSTHGHSHSQGHKGAHGEGHPSH